VKFETTASFDGDFARLSESERKLFLDALKAFVPACDEYAKYPAFKWPKTLRVKDINGAPGIWEMTWSFSGPDGRATFEWIQIDGALALRWRRVGSHGIFKKP